MKTVYLFDKASANYVGVYVAQESPLEPGQFITPTDSTELLPPAVAPGDTLQWTGSAWRVIAAVVAPAPTTAELKANALNQVRSQRAPILSMLDGMQATALTKGDTAKATAIETAKQGLKDLTKRDLSACITEQDFKTSLLTGYKYIAAALPLDVRMAFAAALA